MNVAIRVDASLQIGVGHVMRCLTLAEAIREKGGEVEFICRAHEGHLAAVIERKGFPVHLLENLENKDNTSKGNLFHSEWLGVSQPTDAEACYSVLEQVKPDWLVVDHYAIDKEWQSALKGTYKKLMVIDDLGDRQHLCDLLLDQNYGSSEKKYRSLVPNECNILAGPKYALLRPEFNQWREFSLQRRIKPELSNILITLGGVDPDNYTSQILETVSLSRLPKDVLITVIMGATSPHLLAVQQQAKTMPYKTEVKVNVSNMAEIMANSDLAIGAAGSTTWERCCLGLPTIQMVIAKNQQTIAESLDKKNAIKLVSSMQGLKEQLESSQSWMKTITIGHTASDICDGFGAARVVGEMFSR